MADIDKKIEYEISITGLDTALKQIKTLVTELEKNGITVSKNTKEHEKLEKGTKKLTEEQKKQQKSLEELNKIGLQFINTLKSLGIQLLVGGVGFSGLVSVLTKYNTAAINTNLITGLMGTSFSKTISSVEKTGHQLGLSRNASVELYNSFARTNLITDVSAENFNKVAMTLRERLGPSLDAIKEGLQTYNTIMAANEVLGSNFGSMW